MRLMATARRPTAVRKNVTIPAPLVKEVRRVARERHLTEGRALIALAEKGVQAERDARQTLKLAHGRFLAEPGGAKKDQAGKDLIRAIFGTDAIAEDQIQ